MKVDHDESTGTEYHRRQLVDIESLEEREEEPTTHRYWLRKRSAKSCEQMIQDLLSRESDSDSGSESQETLNYITANCRLQSKIGQGKGIDNNNLEATAGRGQEPDNPRDHAIEIRDVTDDFSDSSTMSEARDLDRSPYSLRSHKKLLSSKSENYE